MLTRIKVERGDLFHVVKPPDGLAPDALERQGSAGRRDTGASCSRSVNFLTLMDEAIRPRFTHPYVKAEKGR